MKKNYYSYFLSIIIFLLFTTGCNVASAFTPTITPSQTLPPTETATPTITPTATEIPFYLDAMVWSGDLEVPILIYHKFVPDYQDTDATQMRLTEFREELQTFYDNGFSLISLKDWIEGDFTVPEGRKPMVLTIDDLWFGNQIFIRDDGIPSPNSGIGVLWQFSQEHPNFGFHAALFAINGDKYYPEKEVDGIFFAADNVDFFSKSWHIKLGNTIAWAMENGIEVYNHTFDHPWNWPQKSNAEIQDELKKNDYWLRQYLTESGHEDLIPQLDNLIALPEGKWPESESGKKVVLNYKNTEGKPLLAVMEAYNMDDPQFTPSPFSEKFDPFHIARITASKFMTNYIVQNKDLTPTATICKLGPMDEEQATNLDVIQNVIQTAIISQACPQGVFNVNGNVFVSRDGIVSLFKMAGSEETMTDVTPTITVAP